MIHWTSGVLANFITAITPVPLGTLFASVACLHWENCKIPLNPQQSPLIHDLFPKVCSSCIHQIVYSLN
jgi:hypothetical protein